MKIIEDTCTNVLSKQNQPLDQGTEELMNKRMSYLNTLDKKLLALTNVQQTTFQNLKKKKLEFIRKVN